MKFFDQVAMSWGANFSKKFLTKKKKLKITTNDLMITLKLTKIKN